MALQTAITAVYVLTKFGELWSTKGENGTGVLTRKHPKVTFSDATTHPLERAETTNCPLPIENLRDCNYRSFPDICSIFYFPKGAEVFLNKGK